MKILIYGDVHWSQYSSILRSRGNKYSTRLENCIQSINWAEQLADETNCDMILCLGDLFDKPELNAEELTALNDIKWSSKPHVFLVGNHEMGINTLTYSSAHILNMIPNCKIIDKPSMDSCYGSEIIYLPYILETNRKSLKEYIDAVRTEYWSNMWTTDEYKSLIIFSHNDIAGIRYGKYESKIGFNMEEIYNSCNYFINGHLHNQTQLNNKMINLGNLTGQNFSEDAEKFNHCVGILDTGNPIKLDLIVNPYALNFYKFEINSESEFNKIDICKDQSIVSIKIYDYLADKIKEYISKNKNIIQYRLNLIPKETATLIENLTTTIKSDHIKQFKDYCLEKLGNNDILASELNLL